MKRAKVDSTSIHIFADPTLEWMTTYAVVSHEDPLSWSLSVLVLDSNGVLRRHANAVDPSHVGQTVAEMIQMIQDDDDDA